MSEVTKPKKPAKSKTIWLNSVLAILGIIAALDPALFAVFGPQAVGAVVALVGAANIVLRLLTKQPIGTTPEE